MRTILEEAKTWFLHSLSYHEKLTITLIEGMVDTESEEVQTRNIIVHGEYRINILPASRVVSIQFSQYVAWQVVNESFTAFDEYEQRDDTSFLQMLGRSKYLDYVNDNHGWYADIIGTGKHYRIWTEDEVIDVVTCTEPVITLISAA
jgi:hypothetical protein